MFGFSDQVQFDIDLTSIEGLALTEEFTVSPNPVDKKAIVSFTLENPEDVSMKIFNTVGKVVYESVKSYSSGIQNIELFRKNLDAGIYFMQLSYGEKVLTKKVILK